jgi:DNA-binding CsgD family transcriptional regulator
MGDENASFEEKVRNSFVKVKEDIEKRSFEITKLEILIEEEKKDILELKEQNKGLKENLEEIKAILRDFKNSSIGNNGVSAQRTTTHNNAQQTTTQHNHLQKPKDLTKPLNLTEFERVILSLSDREFSVFLAIYEISNDQGYTTYTQIAERLKITDSPVRHHVMSLISKQIPIQKERILHGKVSLSIKGGVLSPSLIARFMHLRQSYPEEQTTLSI